MCMEGKRHLYLGLYFARYLLWLLRFPKVWFHPVEVLIIFKPAGVTTLTTLRGIQAIGAAAMLPAGVSPYSGISFFSYVINVTIQVGILAHAFPPSRARSLAFATFSSGAALGRGFCSSHRWIFDQIYKAQIISYPSPLTLLTDSIQKNMALHILPISYIQLCHPC